MKSLSLGSLFLLSAVCSSQAAAAQQSKTDSVDVEQEPTISTGESIVVEIVQEPILFSPTTEPRPFDQELKRVWPLKLTMVLSSLLIVSAGVVLVALLGAQSGSGGGTFASPDGGGNFRRQLGEDFRNGYTLTAFPLGSVSLMIAGILFGLRQKHNRKVNRFHLSGRGIGFSF